MNHIALNRTRPDDRDFDHEIVEFARLQPRQHVHLRAALDLKHAERLALAEHVVNFRLFAWQRGYVITLTLMLGDEIKTFPDAGQHAERQHIDLHHTQGIDVVLVPLDEGAILHRSISDRNISIEPVLRQHEAADMLGQMARKFDQFGCQFDGTHDHRIIRIESGLLDLHFAEATAPASPHRVRQRGGDVLCQPQRLADIANGAARAIMDHRRDNRGTMASITLEDVLHYLLAARMLEIDIDIGRLKPLLGDEALEQHVGFGRIDRGDAEHEADR